MNNKPDILEDFHRSYKAMEEAVRNHEHEIILFSEEQFEIREDYNNDKQGQVDQEYYDLPVFYHYGKYNCAKACKLFKVDKDGIAYGVSENDLCETHTTFVEYLNAHCITSLYQKI